MEEKNENRSRRPYGLWINKTAGKIVTPISLTSFVFISCFVIYWGFYFFTYSVTLYSTHKLLELSVIPLFRGKQQSLNLWFEKNICFVRWGGGDKDYIWNTRFKRTFTKILLQDRYKNTYFFLFKTGFWIAK